MALRMSVSALALSLAATPCFAHAEETKVKAAEADSDADDAAKAAGKVGRVGQRCGGKGWTGTTSCPKGLACNHTNTYWWDCQTEADVAKAEAEAKKHILSRSAMVERINSRFANGGPTNDVTSAGILIHQFHNGMDGDWKAWMPCPATCFGGPCWCASFSDRFSASLLNAHTKTQKGKIGMYSLQNPGFIYSPEFAHVSCAYPADGGSESKSCKGEAGCIPGCGKKWCHFDPSMPNNMDTSCAWPSNELERVLRLQETAHSNYNEIVIDAASVVDNLPRSIEAIFFVKGEKAEAEARKVHQDFLATFGDDLAARNIPLLQLDPKNPSAPFVDVTSGGAIAAFELGPLGAGAAAGAASSSTAAVAAGAAMAIAAAISLFAVRAGALRSGRAGTSAREQATRSASPSTEATDIEVAALLVAPLTAADEAQ